MPGHRVRMASNGGVRVAYIEQGIRYAVRYVEWSGVLGADPVDVTIGADDVIPPPQTMDLALDPQDHPGVTYYSASDHSLWFSANTGSGWRSETVSASNSTARVAMTFDSTGNPLVFAVGPWLSMTSGLYVVTHGTTGWVGSLLEKGVASMHAERDNQDRVNVWYYTTGSARHVVGGPRAWVDAPITPAAPGPVAYGPGDELHVLVGGRDTPIQYAHYDGCVWSYQDVDTDPKRRAAVAIAVDATGTPHIAYQSTLSGTTPPTPNELWYARPSVQ